MKSNLKNRMYIGQHVKNNVCTTMYNYAVVHQALYCSTGSAVEACEAQKDSFLSYFLSFTSGGIWLYVC